MTISSTTSRWSYEGNGATTAFSYTNLIFASTDLKVYLDGELQGSGYTVSGVGEAPGGNVTFSVAPDDGAEVVIVRRVPNTQPTLLPSGGPFPAKSVERMSDRATIGVQQLASDLERTVTLAEGSAAAPDLTLPDPVAGKALKWNDAGDGLENSTTDPDTAAEAAATSASAAAASASAASSSATAASGSATAASGSATAAAASAVEAASQAAALVGTSATSLAVGTGSKAFTTQASKQFGAGSFVMITSDANVANFMFGQVTAYSGTSLTVEVTAIGGSGTHADWTIRVAGTRGATGATGSAGAAGDAGPVVGGNVLCPHEGLVVKQASNSTVDIDATALLLRTAAGVPLRVTAVDLTVSIASAGANGLDTGSEANSTWYHLWVISDGAATAGLLSLSATAPTMPGGYTYKGYVGAVRNDGSGNLIAFFQRASMIGVSHTSLALTDGAATSFTTVDISSFVPPNAIAVLLQVFVQTSTGTAYAYLEVASAGSGTTGSYGQISTARINPSAAGDFQYAAGELLLSTAQQVSYFVSGTNARARIRIVGWRF